MLEKKQNTTFASVTALAENMLNELKPTKLELAQLIEKYLNHPNTAPIIEAVQNGPKTRIHLSGLSGSSKSVLTAAILPALKGLQMLVFTEKEEAAYFYNDLKYLLKDHVETLFFPSAYKRSIQYQQSENGNVILRSNVLNVLSKRNKQSNNPKPLVIVSYPEALAEKVVSSHELQDNTLTLRVGEQLSIEFVQEVLNEYEFEYSDFVYEPGQYAIRGGIIDVFSYAYEYPFRIDFFGDEIESIRAFDVENQLSKDKVDEISLMPQMERLKLEENTALLTEFSNEPLTIWSNAIQYTAERFSQIYEQTLFDSETEKQAKIAMGNEWLSSISGHSLIEFGAKSYFPDSKEFSFTTQPQPLFKKNFNLLGDNLKSHLNRNYRTIILSDSDKQIARLHAIFNETHSGLPFENSGPALHEGFIDDTLQLCIYTDHQIFDRYHKYQINTFFSSKATLSLRELKDLNPGDYVVHVDHGIGRFGGLEKIMVNDKVQETIKLVYRDNDVLYVNIHSLHRISKYKGKDDSEPKIYKLGTGAWQKLKQTTKTKVKDIAKDLIALYAKRKAQKGFAFSADTYLQEELEASFIYEDTPDQEKATQAIKEDMEKTMPMDRLVCGDVGFGKTELAVRAAFKAVSDSKQVAVLVPTTILAFQHYQTFKERLADFPCKIDYISRMKKASMLKDTLKMTKQGEIDILIGTHRLLGKDIEFKDLGLLIIDEEQKFGVTAKEKLKALKINVDTMTMTATPIPRTLQFSLLGARDLSILNTPPPNRHPIITEVHTFNEDIIKEGIEFEVSRGGQVFFIHNRVQNIYEVENLIKKLCPHVKTCVGHGQMDGPHLEQLLIDFINGDFDVLIATTIIESGLDIPNANTIFINNAQNFGLSDLHQLRGRVGRSNKKAFCYLLAPPLTMVTSEARRRLKAIEEFSDLGSGIHIAMQDLDIRGAGNMLGAEQSGFISDIGFETYNRILEEALLELKEHEFKDLFKDEETPKADKGHQPLKRYVTDCVIDTDLEIHLPDTYVSNISERVRLYRRLDNAVKKDELLQLRNELIDRFGALPQPAERLFKTVQLRWMAMDAGFEKMILKREKFIVHFVSDQQSDYYQSAVFRQILNFVQQQPRRFRMKEAKDKLSMTIDFVTNLDEALEMLQKLLANDESDN